MYALRRGLQAARFERCTSEYNENETCIVEHFHAWFDHLVETTVPAVNILKVFSKLSHCIPTRHS